MNLWNYIQAYPDRLKNQFYQGMGGFAQHRNPVSVVSSLNPTSPFIQDAAVQAGGLIAPQVNALSRLVSQGSENLGLGPLSIPAVTDEQLAPFLMLGMGGRNKMGFYSPSGKALTTAPGKGQSGQYLAHLKKEPGATKEAKETGLLQALEQAPGTLTKEEVVSMWNPIELDETVRAGHRDHYIKGLSVGGVDFYRDGAPVDYSPHVLAKRAGNDKPTSAEHARAVLIEDVLIDEWKLKEGWEERGEQGVVDAVQQKISERIASWEDELGMGHDSRLIPYDPDDDALREQILELRDIQNRIPHLYSVQMDEASRQPLKYGEEQNLNLPGGSNPKEILVQLPEKPPNVRTYAIKPPDGSPNYAAAVQTLEGAQEEASRIGGQIVKVIDTSKPMPNYTGGHWSEPNVLAHIRTNERDVGGKKALHIEEIQSDWHQQGQKKGYYTGSSSEYSVSETEDGLWEIYDSGGELVEVEHTREAAEDVARQFGEGALTAAPGAGTVPDAPFKKDWHELAFKRALMEGINDPSIERLTWTTGDVQADRYNLAKYINSIEAQAVGDNFNLAVIHKDGHAQNLRNVTPDELSDHVGKEMAEKIVREKGGMYSGLDLEVGGEYHKQLYDGKITNFAKKFLKKYGVEPQRIFGPSTDVTVTKDGYFYYLDNESGNWDVFRRKQAPLGATGGGPNELIESFKNFNGAFEELRKYGEPEGLSEDYWSIDITPEMRQDLQEKGVPLAMNTGLMPKYA